MWTTKQTIVALIDTICLSNQCMHLDVGTHTQTETLPTKSCTTSYEQQIGRNRDFAN